MSSTAGDDVSKFVVITRCVTIEEVVQKGFTESMSLISLSRNIFSFSFQGCSYQQTASFSKYISKTRAKHLPLNTKRAGKGYKKGYGARTEGRITSTGKFIPIASMRTELVVPDLTNFKVSCCPPF